MELQPGDTFAGRFRIVRRLGVGGFGEVHEATDLTSQTAVALKVLHADLVNHPAMRERFDTESRVTTQFRSAHVAALVDAGVDGATKRPWVAFELAPGEELAALLKRVLVFTPVQVVAMFTQLGDALGAAHQAGVIHSDVKPENVLVAGTADAPQVKVLDFGIARVLRAGRTSTKVTTPVGSPAWTAPEQFISGAKLRPSADVWPLGLLAFRMLTGQHYLRNAGDDFVNVIPCVMEICAGDLAAASARARELGVAERLPAEFDRWFQHCVTREPDARFQHARAAVTALCALLRPPTAAHAATVELRAPPIAPSAGGRGTVALPSMVLPAVEEMLAHHDYGRARHAIEHAIAQGDDQAEVWALRGECDQRLGRYDDALDDWSQAIVRAPAVGAYLHGRAMVFDAMGKTAAAEADRTLAALVSARR